MEERDQEGEGEPLEESRATAGPEVTGGTVHPLPTPSAASPSLTVSIPHAHTIFTVS